MSTWQTKHVDSNSYILSELVQVFFQIPFLFLEGWNAKSSLCHWRRNPCQDGLEPRLTQLLFFLWF